MRRCSIRPAAQAEIDQQAEYLAEHVSEGVALRFLAAVEETVAILIKNPGIGSPWLSDHPRLQGIRKHHVDGFPNHLIFYRHDDKQLESIHLYHGAQNIDVYLQDEADSAGDA